MDKIWLPEYRRRAVRLNKIGMVDKEETSMHDKVQDVCVYHLNGFSLQLPQASFMYMIHLIRA